MGPQPVRCRRRRSSPASPPRPAPRTGRAPTLPPYPLLPGSPTALAQPVTSTCRLSFPSHATPGPQPLPSSKLLFRPSAEVGKPFLLMGLLPSAQGSGDSAAGTAQQGQPRRGADTPSPSRACSSSPQSPSQDTGRLLAARRDPREPRPALAAFGPPLWAPGPGAPGHRPQPVRGPRASAAALGLTAEGGRSAQGRVRGKSDHTHFKIHLLQFFKFCQART